tara:strand:+ start:1491 stop:1946 length:456 start_codon:yes stop_codon:yes gene_type:complete
VGALEIIDPWVKPSFGGSRSSKLFFEFRNKGKVPDRLVAVESSATSTAGVFKVVSVEKNIRKVEEVDAIEMPAGMQSFELSEVGYYIELLDLELPILMGSRLMVNLTFRDAGSIQIEFLGRFHSPKLNRRIKTAATRGDIEALKEMTPSIR